MANNILRGLDIAAGATGEALNEMYRRRLAAAQQQKENERLLQEREYQSIVQKRSQIFQERMAKYKEFGDMERFNKKQAEEQRQFDISSGLEKKRLEALRRQNELSKKANTREDFMSQYKLYGNNIDLLNNQLRNELSVDFPDMQRINVLRSQIAEQEKNRDEFGRTQGARIGFVTPTVSVSDQYDIARQIIQKRMGVAGPETQSLPPAVQERLAKQKIMFGDTIPQSGNGKEKPSLDEIFQY